MNRLCSIIWMTKKWCFIDISLNAVISASIIKPVSTITVKIVVDPDDPPIPANLILNHFSLPICNPPPLVHSSLFHYKKMEHRPKVKFAS